MINVIKLKERKEMGCVAASDQYIIFILYASKYIHFGSVHPANFLIIL